MKNIYKYISGLFVIFWILFIYADYMQKHPRMFLAVEYFRYFGLYFFYLIVFAVMSFLVYQKKILNKIKPFITWLSFFILTMVLALANLTAYMVQYSQLKPSASLNFGNYISFIGSYLFLALATFLIISVCYSAGNLFNRFIKAKFQPVASELIDIGSGILILVLFVFLLGIVGLLNPFVMWPVLILLVAINYKSWLHFIKTVLLKPIKIPENLNLLGIFPMFCLLVIFSINFPQIIRPIPTGFDAIQLYVNLPALVADHQALVAGFQPYNWSLFMSLGFILFDKTEVALSLSAAGGLLSLFLMFYLGKNWLKININLLLLCLTVFYLAPTIVHQSSKELKVDLGLLYFSFCCIILFIYWYYQNNKSLKIKDEIDMNYNAEQPFSFSILQKIADSRIVNFISKKVNPYLILLGLFCGFALGIKLTAAFLILAVTATMWYIAKGRIGFIAMFCVCIFAVLFLKLDQTGDLRQYHLSATLLMYLALLIGIAIIVWLFIKDRKIVLHYVKTSVIYAIIVILTFLPWAAKNIIETGSLSVDAILIGKKLGPDIDATVIIKNFQDYNAR